MGGGYGIVAAEPLLNGHRHHRRHHGPFTLEVLPAGYGDCLLVTCPVGRRSWRMLIDTGPDECWPTLRDRLARIVLYAANELEGPRLSATCITRIGGRLGGT
jgi:hypothetical protein